MPYSTLHICVYKIHFLKKNEDGGPLTLVFGRRLVPPVGLLRSKDPSFRDSVVYLLGTVDLDPRGMLCTSHAIAHAQLLYVSLV